jgi:Na+-translocating ferredoxin:NAD+ oxidoreductase RnfG subunit
MADEAGTTGVKGDAARAEPAGGAASRGSAFGEAVRYTLVLFVICALSAGLLAFFYALTREKIEASKSAKTMECFALILAPGRPEAAVKEAVGPTGRHFVLTCGAVNGASPLGLHIWPLNDDFTRFRVTDDESGGQPSGATVAYAAQVKCSGSYNGQSPVEILVVLSPDRSRVIGAAVVASAETPGLGEQIKDPPSAWSYAGRIAGRKDKERLALASGGVLVGRVERLETGFRVTLADGSVRDIPAGEVTGPPAGPPFPAAFMDQFTGRTVERARLKADGGDIDAITGATVTSRAVTNGVRAAAEALRDLPQR